MRKIIAVITAFCLELTALMAGTYYHGYFTHGVLFFIIAITVIILLFILNISFSIKKNKKSLNLQQQDDRMLQERNLAEQDLPAAISRLNRVVLISRLYLGSLMLLMIAAAFFFGALRANNTWNTLCMLLLTYCQYAMVSVVLSAGNHIYPNYEIFAKDYPVLFALIGEVMAEAGLRREFKVYNADSISVFCVGKCVCILLNAPEVKILTKEELKQVLLHEIAHVCLRDTDLYDKWNKIAEQWDPAKNNPFLNIGRLLTKIPEYYIRFYYEMFHITASRAVEIQADHFVKKHGNPQIYINACAKATFWMLFFEEPCIDMEYYLYQNETPPEDIAGYMIDCFYKEKEKNKDRWNRILMTELPARIDSHPTFKMRMENAGIQTYTADTLGINEAFEAEQDRLIGQYNEIQHVFYQENYIPIRQRQYTDRNKLLFAYESTQDADNTFDLMRLSDVVPAYYGLNTAEAYRIIEVILQRDAHNAYALYYRGMYRLNEADDRGVADLYQAMDENHNFTLAGLDLIGRYALKYGKQFILEEYRAHATLRMQHVIDHHSDVGTVRKRDRIVKNDLPDKDFREVLNHITEYSQNYADKIYTAKKVISEALSTYIYIIKFAEPEEDECDEIEDIFTKIFKYLDMREEQFTLLDYSESQKSADILLASVPDCCIYER